MGDSYEVASVISSREEEESEDDDECHQQKRRRPTAGRGVTLAMLMADQIIEPGVGLMSVEYLGQQFIADLLPDGRISCSQNKMVFSSPSAWAIYCKKLVNPTKKSGCGWASVRYKGNKLDTYKSIWFRKHTQQARPSVISTLNGDSIYTARETDSSERETKVAVHPPEGVSTTSQPVRISVQHSSLGRHSPSHDPRTLVSCATFAWLGKVQPFSIAFSSNSLLLAHFHCHLSRTEVVGYLAGKWDPTTQLLAIHEAFPCCCDIQDANVSASVETEIRDAMRLSDLQLVGWYHSHPSSQPDPSLRDIESQMEYQLMLKGCDNSYHPCLGVIISPFTGESRSSVINAYWVMPPPETRPLEYGMPVSMRYSKQQEAHISRDTLAQLKHVVDYYTEGDNRGTFLKLAQSVPSYQQVVEKSLASNLPHDIRDSQHVLEMLTGMLPSEETKEDVGPVHVTEEQRLVKVEGS